MPHYILLRETASTNTYLSRMASILPSGTVVYTPRQSAGRGQRGNYWESEPEKNLTFSLLLKNPAIAPVKQFYISEAISLAIIDVLSAYSESFSIKWPNDIYYNDYKICGTLIETTLEGNKIENAIIGTGINVNQTNFLSNAPNPISLSQIVGKEINLEGLLRDLCTKIEQSCEFEGKDDSYFMALHSRYLNHIYRKDGQMHTFATPEGVQFEAAIDTIEPTGTLCLRLADGTINKYAFKEVSFIIK